MTSELPIEVTITLKGVDASTCKHKFLEYRPITLVYDDPTLQDLLTQAKAEYKAEIEDVKIRCSMQFP